MSSSEQNKPAKRKVTIGRPKAFSSKKKLMNAIDKYINNCRENKQKPTIAGCAFEIGIDRQTFYNYDKDKDFFDVIKRTRDYILAEMESHVVNSQGNPAGTIFLMKNYGYRDKSEDETRDSRPLIVINGTKIGIDSPDNNRIIDAKVVDDE